MRPPGKCDQIRYLPVLVALPVLGAVVASLVAAAGVVRSARVVVVPSHDEEERLTFDLMATSDPGGRIERSGVNYAMWLRYEHRSSNADSGASHQYYWMPDPTSAVVHAGFPLTFATVEFERKPGAAPAASNIRLAAGFQVHSVRVRWVGAILNTLLTSLLLFFVRCGIHAVAASWRCRRGRCPHCGYSRASSHGRCSECGHIGSRLSTRAAG